MGRPLDPFDGPDAPPFPPSLFPLGNADWALFLAEQLYDETLGWDMGPRETFDAWQARRDNWLDADAYVSSIVLHRWADGLNLGNVAAYAGDAGFRVEEDDLPYHDECKFCVHNP